MIQRSLDASAGSTFTSSQRSGLASIWQIVRSIQRPRRRSRRPRPLMAKASVVVSHGGHGTMMRALKYGVPMLMLPGWVPDQAPNSATVGELGAGRVLAPDANSEAIAAAAREMLATPQYRHRAKEVAKLFSGADGAGRCGR